MAVVEVLHRLLDLVEIGGPSLRQVEAELKEALHRQRADSHRAIGAGVEDEDDHGHGGREEQVAAERAGDDGGEHPPDRERPPPRRAGQRGKRRDDHDDQRGVEGVALDAPRVEDVHVADDQHRCHEEADRPREPQPAQAQVEERRTGDPDEQRRVGEGPQATASDLPPGLEQQGEARVGRTDHEQVAHPTVDRSRHHPGVVEEQAVDREAVPADQVADHHEADHHRQVDRHPPPGVGGPVGGRCRILRRPPHPIRRHDCTPRADRPITPDG